MKKFLRFVKLYFWTLKHGHGDLFYNEPTEEVICLGCGEDYKVTRN